VTDSTDRDAELARHRAAIDALDRDILAHLNARAKHAQAIGALKSGGAAYRPEREAQVLARLQDANTGPLPDEAVACIFRETMSACLALEQTLRVGYLGPPGTFSHEAVGKHFGQSVDMQPYATIDDVFQATESGQTDHAVVPVENSTEGAVGRTLDLMFQTPLVICGEIRLRVRVGEDLVDHGGDGITSNAVNADRIRSGLLTGALIKKRAKARGMTEHDYLAGNLLGQEVLADDVGEAFVSLALARKTTGAVLTVDGGNIAAAPR